MSDEPAAGLRALEVTYQHARKQTGLVRALRVLTSANQTTGFDCPGCAWPDPEHRSAFEFCENGAKAILDESTTRRVDAEFFKAHSIADLRAKSERWLNDQGRLTEPMILRSGADHYEPLSYQEAFSRIATELKGFNHPDEAAFYTSGRTSNEAAFLYQLLVRAYGTNNLPDCSNLCHESSGVALKETLGIGKGTVRLEDFERSDLIFVVGQNPGTNHPRMLSALRSAKLKGATIVSVNPLIEKGLVKFAHPQEPSDLLSGGVSISDHFIRVALNGDQAFFRGLNKALLDAGDIDEDFIAQFCDGIDEFRREVQRSPWTTIEAHSGISRKDIEAIARLVRRSHSVICCWAMGLTQHQNAVVTIQEVTNFLLLRGNVGKPGAGACPVRGHSNVQGDRTVGIAPSLPPDFKENLERECHMKVPAGIGVDTVSAISAMKEGKVRALISLGGNFLSASPDTDFTEAALRSCDLTVQISTKLNKSHLATGKTGILLPCLGRTEEDTTGGLRQHVTVENSMGIVHSSEGSLPPAAEGLLSEPAIIAGIAQELLDRDACSIDFASMTQDYDRIRDLIEKVVPGFSRYNERVRAPGGFELPNGPRERDFTTTQGRAQLIPATLERATAKPGELLLTTIRSHDQFNTTVYSDDDRYRGIRGDRRVVLLAPDDLKSRRIESGEPIRITSFFKPDHDDAVEQTRTLSGFTAVAYDIPSGTAAAYFPEANPLIFLDSFADRSRTPTSKSVRVTIEGMGGTRPTA